MSILIRSFRSTCRRPYEERLLVASTHLPNPCTHKHGVVSLSLPIALSLALAVGSAVELLLVHLHLVVRDADSGEVLFGKEENPRMSVSATLVSGQRVVDRTLANHRCNPLLENKMERYLGENKKRWDSQP